MIMKRVSTFLLFSKIKGQICPGNIRFAQYLFIKRNTAFYPKQDVRRIKQLFIGQSRKHSQTSELTSCEPEIKDKIIYNSKLNKLSFLDRKRLEKSQAKKESAKGSDERLLPISLKYILGDDELTESKEQIVVNSEPELVNLPLRIKVSDPELIEIEGCEDNKNSVEEPLSNDDIPEIDDFVFNTSSVHGHKWMNDYERYTDNLDDFDNGDWKLDYGTADLSVPVSKVPCGGCGALLHCQDPSIPGYLPNEIFSNCGTKDLRSLTCQRCHFLQNYNTALSVSVDPQFYPTLLSKIKDQKALVILMVDLTDFPCSIWPDILDIIGHKRPLFLVGNKVDLLWGDSKGWMNHVKRLLRSNFPSSANIRHVCLISSKTGFGVEELINKLHNMWQYKGDVYLVGCTNVGKSTLFNALLQSDYCKVKAVDLVQRATVAPWPGTTLNLLKFPILRPEGWRLFLRTQRLMQDRQIAKAERELKKEQMKLQKIKHTTPPQLIGNIGRTFRESKQEDGVESNNDFSVPNRKEIRAVQPPGSGLDPKDPDLENSKWLYDTPGVLHKDQFLDLLTTEELVLTLPKEVIVPRTLLVKPGWTTFIGGVARLDYIQGAESVRITVFSSMSLPITVCATDDAEAVYNGLVGTEYMAVPKGTRTRLQNWPDLQKGPKISVCGISLVESSVDLVLSSAGWIAITPAPKEMTKFVGWTPQGRGIYVRHPALLPHAVALKGKRISKTPVYNKTKPYSQ